MSKNWDLKLEKSGKQGLREERGHRAKVRKNSLDMGRKKAIS